MSGSCKHQKRCGLSWLRLLYIFLNKFYLHKKKARGPEGSCSSTVRYPSKRSLKLSESMLQKIEMAIKAKRNTTKVTWY